MESIKRIKDVCHWPSTDVELALGHLTHIDYVGHGILKTWDDHRILNDLGGASDTRRCGDGKLPSPFAYVNHRSCGENHTLSKGAHLLIPGSVYQTR